MSITISGREYKTLNDKIYINGRRVIKAYANGSLVYPEKPYAVRMRLKSEYHFNTRHSWTTQTTANGYWDIVARLRAQGFTVNTRYMEPVPGMPYAYYEVIKTWPVDSYGDVEVIISSDKEFGQATIDLGYYEHVDSSGRDSISGFEYYWSTSGGYQKPLYHQPFADTSLGHYNYAYPNKSPLINLSANLSMSISGSVSCPFRDFHDPRYFDTDDAAREWATYYAHNQFADWSFDFSLNDMGSVPNSGWRTINDEKTVRIAVAYLTQDNKYKYIIPNDEDKPQYYAALTHLAIACRHPTDPTGLGSMITFFRINGYEFLV